MEATSARKHVEHVDIENVDIKTTETIEEGGHIDTKVFNMEVQKLRWLSLITIGLMLFGGCLNVVMLGSGMRGTTWHINHNEVENSNPPKMFPQLKSCAHNESWLAEHDENGNIQESIVDQDETIMMLDSIKDGVSEFVSREAGHFEFIKVIRLDEVTSDGSRDYFPLRATESDGRLNQHIVILCRDEPASRCHMFIPVGKPDEHEYSTQIHLADSAQKGMAYQISISTELSDLDLDDDNGNVTDGSTTGRQLADSDGNPNVRRLWGIVWNKGKCKCDSSCYYWGWHKGWCYTSRRSSWWPHGTSYTCHGDRIAADANDGWYHGRLWSDAAENC